MIYGLLHFHMAKDCPRIRLASGTLPIAMPHIIRKAADRPIRRLHLIRHVHPNMESYEASSLIDEPRMPTFGLFGNSMSAPGAAGTTSSFTMRTSTISRMK